MLRQLALLMQTGLAALLAPAEDPRQTFADVGDRQRALLFRVQQAHTANINFGQRLRARQTQLHGNVSQLEDKARAALAAGHEDLSRLALRQRQMALNERNQLTGALHEIDQESQRLAFLEQRLSGQIEVFGLRQEVIAARYDAAEAQVKINESLSGVSDELTDLGLAIEDAEQKAEHMQARAGAIDRLIDENILNDPLWPLDGLGDDIEAQLVMLKSGSPIA